MGYAYWEADVAAPPGGQFFDQGGVLAPMHLG
jgi:hypothetical protein